MAIGVYSSEEGMRLCELRGDYMTPLDAALREALGGLVIQHPGSQCITPEAWTRHTHEYFLTVKPDGTGEYHRIPRPDDLGRISTIRATGNIPVSELNEMRGATVTPIGPTEKTRYMPLLGVSPRHQDFRLWSVVCYVPEADAAAMPLAEPREPLQ